MVKLRILRVTGNERVMIGEREYGFNRLGALIINTWLMAWRTEGRPTSYDENPFEIVLWADDGEPRIAPCELVYEALENEEAT